MSLLGGAKRDRCVVCGVPATRYFIGESKRTGIKTGNIYFLSPRCDTHCPGSDNPMGLKEHSKEEIEIFQVMKS